MPGITSYSLSDNANAAYFLCTMRTPSYVRSVRKATYPQVLGITQYKNTRQAMYALYIFSVETLFLCTMRTLFYVRGGQVIYVRCVHIPSNRIRVSPSLCTLCTGFYIRSEHLSMHAAYGYPCMLCTFMENK